MKKTIQLFVLTCILAAGSHLPANTASYTLASTQQAKSIAAQGDTLKIHVKGMVCDFCARGLEKSFGKREEVSQISVNLDSGLVTVMLKPAKEMSDKVATKIITNNGYNVVKIERTSAEKA